MIYKITKDFPNDERFGLISQMRRSAVSVTSNLAEGFGRRGVREKIRFYDIALGSLFELQNQLIISKDVGYLSQDFHQDIQDSSVDVQKLTLALIRSIKM